MTLHTLAIEGFRNLEPTEIRWHPQTNLIVGSNAAGKTSLLEAIHYLARLQSFRTARIRSVIRQGGEMFRLVGRFGDHARRHVLGVEVTARYRRVRLDGNEVVRRSDVVACLPLQILNQDAHLLIEAGPEHRRRFMDWGVFHVEPAYRGLLTQYHRLLRQRNAALRQGADRREIRVWDREMADKAIAIDRLRRRHVALLERMAVDDLKELAPLGRLRLSYRPGWSEEKSLVEQLGERLEADRERGFTHVGPHRADIGILVDERMARDRLSRGQQKLLVAAFVIAQLRLLCERGSNTPLILVDDLPAELDRGHRERLLALLDRLPVQRFITAIEAGQLPAPGGDHAEFHVKHGRLVDVVYY